MKANVHSSVCRSGLRTVAERARYLWEGSGRFLLLLGRDLHWSEICSSFCLALIHRTVKQFVTGFISYRFSVLNHTPMQRHVFPTKWLSKMCLLLRFISLLLKVGSHQRVCVSHPLSVTLSWALAPLDVVLCGFSVPFFFCIWSLLLTRALI